MKNREEIPYGPNCSGCAYVVDHGALLPDPHITDLHCHRYPPTVLDRGTDAVGNPASSWFPRVTQERWCGEHRPSGRA